MVICSAGAVVAAPASGVVPGVDVPAPGAGVVVALPASPLGGGVQATSKIDTTSIHAIIDLNFFTENPPFISENMCSYTVLHKL